MGIRSENHSAAAGHGFTVVGMDVSQVGRHIDATIFMGRRKGKLVVVFIDGSADSTERVMAVSKYIRKWKFLHPGSTRCLNDADIRNIMAGHGVILQLQVLHIPAFIMGSYDLVSHCAFAGFCLVSRSACEQPDLFTFFLWNNFSSVYQINTAVI